LYPFCKVFTGVVLADFHLRKYFFIVNAVFPAAIEKCRSKWNTFCSYCHQRDCEVCAGWHASVKIKERPWRFGKKRSWAMLSFNDGSAVTSELSKEIENER